MTGPEDDPSLRDTGDQDYALHIPEPSEQEVPVSDAQREIDTFLKPYEECLRNDAYYYSIHPEMLSKIERGGHFWQSERPIKQMQFWTDEDRYTFWAVEMDLKEDNGSDIWIPQTTTFVRLVRTIKTIQQTLPNVWVASSQFLHPTVPYGESYRYDTDELKPGIFSHTCIKANALGKIYYISVRSSDEAAGTKSFQETILERNDHPNPPSTVNSHSLRLIQQMLQPLPLERLRHQPPPK